MAVSALYIDAEYSFNHHYIAATHAVAELIVKKHSLHRSSDGLSLGHLAEPLECGGLAPLW
jgi:hypothetical protein